MQILRAGIPAAEVSVWEPLKALGLEAACETAEPTGSHATHPMLHHEADQLKQDYVFLEFIYALQLPALPSLS